MSKNSQTSAGGSVLLFLFVVLALPPWLITVYANAKAGDWGGTMFALALPVLCAAVGAVIEAAWFLMRGKRWP